MVAAHFRAVTKSSAEQVPVVDSVSYFKAGSRFEDFIFVVLLLPLNCFLSLFEFLLQLDEHLVSLLPEHNPLFE